MSRDQGGLHPRGAWQPPWLPVRRHPGGGEDTPQGRRRPSAEEGRRPGGRRER